MPVDSIITEPPDIIIPPIYKFNPLQRENPENIFGYEIAPWLKKGEGYWLKSLLEGCIILPYPNIIPGCGIVWHDGKRYNTVVIGTQCWLRENLDVGTMINRNVIPSDNGVIEKYCYDDDPNMCDIYGGLYQWEEAMQYSMLLGAQGICPNGWHIPTVPEFDELAAAVGYDGNALKAFGVGGGAGAGTNTSGFSALLAGERSYVPPYDFIDLDVYTHYYSSDENGVYLVESIGLGATTSTIVDYASRKDGGVSIRCIKDYYNP
jgi:uncharacterized protein (TIGR02145 family)